MPSSVVCVSKVTAAGGEAIGRRVAERLGFRCVDDEVITVAARQAGVDPSAVAEAEHHSSLVARVLDALFAPPQELRGYLEWHPREGYAEPAARAPSRPPTDEVRRFIEDAIAEIAARGSVVILAHAASLTLAGRPDVLRVHVVASKATRLRRLWIPNKLVPEEEYARELEESDRQRQKYLERFHGIREESAAHYDLVVNTDALDVERAVAAVVAAAAA